MVYQAVEKLLPQAGGNTYTLVTLVARRALELAEGAPKLVEASANEKVTTTAMREILVGKVVIKAVAEQFDPTKQDTAKE